MTAFRAYGPFTTEDIARAGRRNLRAVRQAIATGAVDPEDLLDLSVFVVRGYLRGVAGTPLPDPAEILSPSPGAEGTAPVPATLPDPPEEEPPRRKPLPVAVVAAGEYDGEVLD